jgi:hypothetical protein
MERDSELLALIRQMLASGELKAGSPAYDIAAQIWKQGIELLSDQQLGVIATEIFVLLGHRWI